MMKIAYAIQLMAVLVSSAALADNDRWGGRGYGWGGGNGWGHYQHQGWSGYYGGYPAQQMNNYYPQPQANYYYQQSPRYYQAQPPYYAPQPQFNNGAVFTNIATLKDSPEAGMGWVINMAMVNR